MLSRPQVYRISLTVSLIGILALSIHALGDVTQLKSWLDSKGSLAPFLFVIVGIVLMSALVPKTVMSITAGILFGTYLGSGLMLIVAVAAAWMNYQIGQWWLPQSANQSRHTVDFTNEESLAQTIRQMAAEAGFFSHLLVRLSPVPTMVISYLMGASNARRTPYLLAAAVAVIPQILWVHSGTAVELATKNSSEATIAQWTGIVIAVTGGLLVAIFVPREALRRLKETRSGQYDIATTGTPLA